MARNQKPQEGHCTNMTAINLVFVKTVTPA